jgi:hypothetical protein
MMNQDQVEPVVFTVDMSEVETGVKKSNAAIEDYRGRTVKANKDVGESFDRMIVIHDRSRSEMEKYIGTSDRFRRSSESIAPSLKSMATGLLEVAAAGALATKVLAAHTTAVGGLEAAINRVRAAEVGLATFTGGFGGGIAVAAEIAAVVALEKIVVTTYERAKQMQRDAVASQKSGLSYEDTASLDFISKRAGVSPDFFNSAVKSAGGIDELAESLKRLGAIRDPVDQVRQTFLAFGADVGEKMLPLLGDRFGDNATRVKEWGLVLDSESRTNISTFKRDIDSLKGALHSLSDTLSASGENAGNWFANVFGGAWKSIIHDIPEFLMQLGGNPEWKILSRLFAGQDSIDLDQRFRREAANAIGDPALATRDSLKAAGERMFASDQGDRRSVFAASAAALQQKLFVSDITDPNYGKLKTGASYPGGPVSEAFDLQRYTSDKGMVARIDADADAQKKLAEAATAAAARLNEIKKSSVALTDREELSPYGELGRLQEQRRAMERQYADDLQKYPSIAKDLEHYHSIAAGVSNREMSRQADKEASEGAAAADLFNNESGVIQAKRTQEQMKAIWDPYLKEMGDRFKTDSEIENIGFESQRREIERRSAQRTQMAPLAPGADEFSQIRNAYDERIQLATELAGIESARIAKEDDANTRAILTAHQQADEYHNIAVAQDEMAIKLAEISKRQFDSIKADAEGLFHTLFTNPSKFGKQLAGTLKEATLKPITEGLGSLTAQSLRPLIYGNDGSGGIAGGFRAMFGGKKEDPLIPLHIETNQRLAGIAALLAASMGVAAPVVIGGSGAAPTVSAPSSVSMEGPGGGSVSPISGPWSFDAPSWGQGVRIDSGGAVTPWAGVVPPDIFNDWGRHTYRSRGAASPSVNSTVTYGGGSGSPGEFIPGPGGSFAPSSGGSDEIGGPSDMSELPQRQMPVMLPDVQARGGWQDSIKRIFQGGGSTNGPGGPNDPTNPKNMWAGLKAGLGGGDRLVAIGGGRTDEASTIFKYGSMTDKLQAGVSSPMAFAAGVGLTQAGTMGPNRGTWGGMAESGIGGALIGAKIGSMIPGVGTGIGAAIGAGAGILASAGEMLAGVMSPMNKAKQEVKELYKINIGNQEANQIVSIAQSKYANNISTAVRSPEVRQMLGLYAAGTGQKNFPLSASTPAAGSLAEQNGQLYQVATSVYGQQHTFASGLPVMGGSSQAGTQYPSPSGPTYVSLNVGESSAADLLEGRIASTVDSDYVQDAYAGSLATANGRTGNSAALQQPGLIVG